MLPQFERTIMRAASTGMRHLPPRFTTLVAITRALPAFARALIPEQRIIHVGRHHQSVSSANADWRRGISLAHAGRPVPLFPKKRFKFNDAFFTNDGIRRRSGILPRMIKFCRP